MLALVLTSCASSHQKTETNNPAIKLHFPPVPDPDGHVTIDEDGSVIIDNDYWLELVQYMIEIERIRAIYEAIYLDNDVDIEKPPR